MLKINEIEKALCEIEGGVFQRLCDDILSKKGYKINSQGTAKGSSKVKTGTPDTIIELESKKYIFVEYTTQKTGVTRKFKDDLKKCLEIEKTGIELKKIEKIFLYHTSKLETSKIEDLNNFCKEQGVILEQWGLSEISYELKNEYPMICKEYLGIEIDTNQILEKEDFIKEYEKNKWATPLRTNFKYRELDMRKALRELETKDILILKGKAGLGKTRLALEILDEFIKKNKNYQSFCILNKSQSIYDDLNLYLKEDKNYIFLIDDINKFKDIEIISSLILYKETKTNVKFIFTVRDYAIEIIEENFNKLDYSVQEIGSLKEEEIKDIIKEEKGIKNQIWLKKIKELSEGNIRLAFMIAKITDKESLLKNITEVYEKYFLTIEKEIETLRDNKVKKVIGIFSFFEVIDLRDKKFLEKISKIILVDEIEIKEIISKLEELEIVDVYKKEIIKISDQIFSTYFAYVIFFRDRLISLEEMIENFLNSHKQNFIDIINPIMKDLSQEIVSDVMKETADNLWKSYSKKQEEEQYNFFDIFWYYKQTEVLRLVKNRIEKLPQEEIDNELGDSRNITEEIPKPYSILLQMKTDDSLEMSLDLLFQYIIKVPKYLDSFIEIAKSNYGIKEDSKYKGYKEELKFIEKFKKFVFKEDKDYLYLAFLEISKYFLKIDFDQIFIKKDRVIFIKIPIEKTGIIIEIRKNILNSLVELYKKDIYKDKVLNLILEYPVCKEKNETTSELYKEESKIILNFIEENLNPKNYNHQILVGNYIERLSFNNVKEEIISKRFNSKIIKFYRFFIEKERITVKDKNFKLIQNKMEDLIKTLNYEDYIELFNIFKEKVEENQNREEWLLSGGTFDILKLLLFEDEELFKELFKYRYLENLLLHYNSPILIGEMVKNLGKDVTFSLIKEYQSEGRFLLDYCKNLKSNQIKKSDCVLLKIKLEKMEVIYNTYDFLLEYENFKGGFIEEIIRLLRCNIKENSKNIIKLKIMFASNTKLYKYLIKTLEINLLKEIYLILDSSDTSNSLDFDINNELLERILKEELDFIDDYLDNMILKDSKETKKQNYEFLWERKDFIELFNKIVNRIYNYKIDENSYRRNYFKIDKILVSFFFGRKDEKISYKQDLFLGKYIKKNIADSKKLEFIFEVICNFEDKRKLKFYNEVLIKNTDLEIFESLRINPIRTFGGSEIPLLENEIEFLEKLKEGCKGLDYLEHRSYLEKIINKKRKRIEIRKERDFIEK